jgi:hypothetical protein
MCLCLLLLLALAAALLTKYCWLLLAGVRWQAAHVVNTAGLLCQLSCLHYFLLHS